MKDLHLKKKNCLSLVAIHGARNPSSAASLSNILKYKAATAMATGSTTCLATLTARLSAEAGGAPVVASFLPSWARLSHHTIMVPSALFEVSSRVRLALWPRSMYDKYVCGFVRESLHVLLIDAQEPQGRGRARTCIVRTRE